MMDPVESQMTSSQELSFEDCTQMVSLALKTKKKWTNFVKHAVETKSLAEEELQHLEYMQLKRVKRLEKA